MLVQLMITSVLLLMRAGYYNNTLENIVVNTFNSISNSFELIVFSK